MALQYLVFSVTSTVYVSVYSGFPLCSKCYLLFSPLRFWTSLARFTIGKMWYSLAPVVSGIFITPLPVWVAPLLGTYTAGFSAPMSRPPGNNLVC